MPHAALTVHIEWLSASWCCILFASATGDLHHQRKNSAVHESSDCMAAVDASLVLQMSDACADGHARRAQLARHAGAAGQTDCSAAVPDILWREQGRYASWTSASLLIGLWDIYLSPWA